MNANTLDLISQLISQFTLAWDIATELEITL